MSYPYFVKFVDVIGSSRIEHPYKRAIFKLCFKKQLKEYPWLLQYKVYIKHLIFH